MKKIRLNDILNLSKEELDDTKIELNMSEGKDGMAHIDLWLSYSEKERESGVTNCSYWPKYGDKNNFRVGQRVLSFVRKDYDEWLFISGAIIKEIPNKRDFAKVDIIEEYKPFFGRIIMKFHKGNAMGRYVFNYSYLKEQEEITEILPCMYNGEKFEGYDNVNLPYKKLKDILDGRIMPTYLEALKKITGIYCLTDTNSGKLYIGSAYGEEGVAQRWGNYLTSKHGENVKLKELYNQKGDSYFEKNFTFTLLEYFGLSYDTEKIIKREQYWKKCFNTIEHGYNDN